MYRLLAASLVVALTNMSSAAAQGDLKQPIGRCATQDGDLKRLACYDSIAKSLGYSRTPAAANVTGSGGWQVSTQKNPLDDTRTVFLSLSATTGQSRFGDAVWLVVRCQSGKINAFINWNSYLGLEQTLVITRLGAGEAKNQKWPLSTETRPRSTRATPQPFSSSFWQPTVSLPRPRPMVSRRLPPFLTWRVCLLL